MCIKVTCVGRAADGSITHIGGSDEYGTPHWGLTEMEAIQRIESGDWSFFVARPGEDPVPVLVRSSSGVKFLTTAPDDTRTNNLAELPVCAPMLSGIDPPFPLSLPGPRQPAIQKVERSGGSGNPPVTVPPDVQGYYRISTWTSSRPLRSVWITCLAPFPADIEVYVDKDPTMSGYSEPAHKLERAEYPLRRKQLEDQAKGWFDYTTLVLGPAYPLRFTPHKLTVLIPQAQSKGLGVTLFIRDVSFNTHCPGPSVPLSVVLYRASYAPPYVYPTSRSSGGVGGAQAPPREYKEGPFASVEPTLNAVGQMETAAPNRRLEIKRPEDVGIGGWPKGFAVYEDLGPPTKLLSHPVGFAPLGVGGGATFSPLGIHGIVLAQDQPNIPGYAAELLFRFVKLGAPSAQPMDVEGFLTTPIGTVSPRILLDPAEQVALVADANRFGAPSNPGRWQVRDLGHGAGVIGYGEFNGVDISATVIKRSDGNFEAAITTDVDTRTVALPMS